MHILLAIDGSHEATVATELLANLPFQEKPKVTVVTAQRESPLDLRTNEDGVAIYEAEKKLALNNIEKVKQRLADVACEVDHVVKFKHPSELILQVAEHEQVDLIVMGARGHNAIYRVVVGSTTEYVTNHARCSVLVARGEVPVDRAWSILLPFDGSEAALTASKQVCELGWPKETNLQVAMLLERPKLLPETEVYDPPAVEESEQELERLDVNKLNCAITRTVRESLHTGNSIRDLADEHECNLVFVGATGKSAVARFFLGSVSRYLLHHVGCSVWVAREKQWDAAQLVKAS